MASESTVDHTILIVDDEESILSSLKRMLTKLKVGIHTTSDCSEALSFLEKYEKPVTLIISDQRMPLMSGVEFLEKSRGISPNSIRFMLTGYSDIDAVVNAVNKGQIHRYLSKPWNDEEMLVQVKESLKQYELINENQVLLDLSQKQSKQLFKFGVIMKKKVHDHGKMVAQQNSKIKNLEKEIIENSENSVKTMAKLIEDNIPLMADHGKRVGRLSRELGLKLKLDEKELDCVELAAFAHDIGKVRQPKEMSKKPVSELNEEEMMVYKTHPEEGEKIVSFSERLTPVAEIIRHHHEHFDGSGWPDGLTGKKIPVGAKIIAVVDAYDNMTKIHTAAEDAPKENSPEETENQETVTAGSEILDYLQEQAGKIFAPEIVKVFIEDVLGKEMRET